MVDGRNTDGMGGGGGGGGEGESEWCEDAAELGSSPGEPSVTVEELVWRRRKTKAGGRRERRGEEGCSLQGWGALSLYTD